MRVLYRGWRIQQISLTGENAPRFGHAGTRVLRLGGNSFTGCIPDALRSVPDNDLAELGLPFCST